jgi:hypothetical protein
MREADCQRGAGAESQALSLASKVGGGVAKVNAHRLGRVDATRGADRAMPRAWPALGRLARR